MSRIFQKCIALQWPHAADLEIGNTAVWKIGVSNVRLRRSALKMRKSMFDNKAAREVLKLSEILAIENET